MTNKTQIVTLTIPKGDDFHHHARTGPTLNLVMSHLVKYCSRAIMMPNLQPAVKTAKDVKIYRNEFDRALQKLDMAGKFEPLMTIAIQDDTTPEDIISAHEAGVTAGKIYPLGVTTNSENGLRDFFSPSIKDVYSAMKDVDMPILIHGEVEGERLMVTDREDFFIETIFKPLLDIIPDQKVVFEHMSTQTAVGLLQTLDHTKVGGTITAHHLMGTLNDVIGNGTHPHQACMPTMKTFDDRDALIEAAMSGIPNFFFGSDSAPHPRTKKECSHGSCGQFTVPMALPMLATVFEKAGGVNGLDKLADFTSKFGAEFYGLPRNKETITLVKEDWVVPEFYGNPDNPDFQFVPPNAGKTLPWQVKE